MNTTEERASLAGTSLIGVVDIGGTKIAAGLLTAEGQVVASREMITSSYANVTAAVDAIAAALRACLEETGCQLAGIGIGCTGPVNPLTGTVGKVANLPGWENQNLTEPLAARFGVSVVMENDADAAALAEHRWGSGKGSSRFVYVTLSTGIGAGIILDGTLYRGKNGAHPELGHHIIDTSGPPCYCGANGCWESLASGHAMRDWFLRNRPELKRVRGFSARDIFTLFDQGDSLAQEAIARLSHYIGIGLANLTTILVPDVIALGGGLTERADAFLPAAEKGFRSICGEVPAYDTAVRLAHLRKHVGLAGAGAVWLLWQQRA